MRIINKSGYPFERATKGSVGFDLRAVIGTHRDIPPGRRWAFDTGIAVELPSGCAGFVQPRSGLTLHHGILATTGTIDWDYRGFIKVILLNTTMESYRVNPGDRIAQLVIVPVNMFKPHEIEEVDELGTTDRGESGFGSTGR